MRCARQHGACMQHIEWSNLCTAQRSSSSPKVGVSAVQLATQVVASMLALEAIDSTSDIKLYINSPGAQHRANWSTRLLMLVPVCSKVTQRTPHLPSAGQYYTMWDVLVPCTRPHSWSHGNMNVHASRDLDRTWKL